MKLFSLGPFIGKEFGKAHKKSWTADRLARKGLISNHPAASPLCDQTEETIDHLLVSCVFSLQVWFAIL